MTVLPVGGVLSPDIAELGLSFANVVLAESDEEVEIALAKLGRSIRGLSSEINKQITLNLEDVLEKFSGKDVRNLLELLALLEERQIKTARTWADMTGIFARLADRSACMRAAYEEVFGAAQELLSSWKDVYIPLVRRARLSVIMFVFRRAQARGILDTQLDAGFEEWFLAASPGEADSWQETAYLLAVPESADRLLRSIGTTSQDKTDQIPGLIG